MHIHAFGDVPVACESGTAPEWPQVAAAITHALCKIWL